MSNSPTLDSVASAPVKADGPPKVSRYNPLVLADSSMKPVLYLDPAGAFRNASYDPIPDEIALKTLRAWGRQETLDFIKANPDYKDPPA